MFLGGCMGISRLQGTPFQIETLRKPEEDIRRHKSKCKYYTKEKCTKLEHLCYGSSHCGYYCESTKTEIFKPIKNLKIEKIPTGEFEVEFLDEKEIIHRIIGNHNGEEHISYDALLTKKVIENKVGSVFKVNEEKVKLISKSIY